MELHRRRRDGLINHHSLEWRTKDVQSVCGELDSCCMLSTRRLCIKQERTKYQQRIMRLELLYYIIWSGTVIKWPDEESKLALKTIISAEWSPGLKSWVHIKFGIHRENREDNWTRSWKRVNFSFYFSQFYCFDEITSQHSTKVCKIDDSDISFCLTFGCNRQRPFKQ